MKTIEAFKREFPQLHGNALHTAYHYLEVLAPSGAAESDFRAIVVDSIDHRGNLMHLKYTITADL